MAVRSETEGRQLAAFRWGARSRRVDHLLDDLDAGRVRVEPDQAERLRELVEVTTDKENES